MKLISSFLVFCIFSVIHIECVLHGDLANLRSFPYVVSIRDSKANYIATGSIISSRFILTSARALDKYSDPKSITVLAGTESLKGADGTELSIEKIIKHCDDIALLRTSDEIIFSTSILPIRISTDDIYSDEIKGQEPVTISGWGKVKYVSIKTKHVGNYAFMITFLIGGRI